MKYERTHDRHMLIACLILEVKGMVGEEVSQKYVCIAQNEIKMQAYTDVPLATCELKSVMMNMFNTLYDNRWKIPRPQD